MPPAKINMKKLKEFAYQRLPRNNPLREVIISEDDELDPNVFLARLSVWLKLSKFLKGEG